MSDDLYAAAVYWLNHLPADRRQCWGRTSGDALKARAQEAERG